MTFLTNNNKSSSMVYFKKMVTLQRSFLIYFGFLHVWLSNQEPR